MKDPINTHYTSQNLEQKILTALETSGVDPNNLTPEHLAPIDQFHIGARPATIKLIQLANLQPDSQILDIGGGLGGPARTLATETNSQVTVLDLTEEYCVVGASLTQRCGLGDLVQFRHGDATDMQLPNKQFDAVWTQHSTMNIADKLRLYKECRRVLKDGGRLAFQEILAGPEQPIHFPVPWAGDASISFLSTPEETRANLEKVGFKEVVWEDASEESIASRKERFAEAAKADDPPALGMHLLLGREAPEMSSNLSRNLEERRVVVVQGVFELV